MIGASPCIDPAVVDIEHLKPMEAIILQLVYANRLVHGRVNPKVTGTMEIRSKYGANACACVSYPNGNG